MKKLFWLVLSVLAFSCKEESVDVRDAAVGNYTEQATYYELQGTTLVQTGNVPADPVTISKLSTADKILIDFGDGDHTTGSNVQPSSKGFTFTIEPFSSSGFSFTGYAGYELDGNHFDGGFSKDGNTIELWYKYTHNNTIKVVRCNMTRQ